MTYQSMVETYEKYGYRLLELPRLSVEERVEFMLSEITR